MTVVKFQILGPVRVRRGSADLDLGGRQQRLVLAMLLANAGSVVSVSELVDTLWEEEPPTSAVNVVHRYIGMLRRLFEPGLPIRATGDYLVRQAAGYQLRVDDDSLDLLRFRTLVRRARESGDQLRAVALFTEALSLWQGRLAAGLEPTSQTHPVFIGVEAERAQTVREAADTALHSGQARLVIPALRQATGQDPLNEALQARMLLALAADGRQAEAVDLFRAVRVRLRDELGISPGAELQDAYDRLLHQRAGARPLPEPYGVAPAPATRSELVGRDEEQIVLRRLLTGATAGRGAAVLVTGSAGVGKSALLRAAGNEAAERGFTVLSTAGVETERWFPFAALHLLLQPLTTAIDSLPESHRLVLRGAFGAVDSQPDAYRVAFAVLELLADAADRQPLLLLCDDLQWFDTPSREVLGFVARRVRDHAMLVVGSVRGEAADWLAGTDYPQLDLAPLPLGEATELLDSRAPELTPPVRALILERSAGNPLALVELPKAVHGGAERGYDLPLTQRLEAAFAARTGEVSAACRTFLLVAAAEPTAPPARLLAVASRLVGSPVTWETAREAVESGMLTPSHERIEFLHPLMRSAVHNRATLGDRLAAHRALAAEFADDPERRLIHLAAASFGPDDGLAAELEQFADGAQDRGQVAAAVPALSRAAGLVTDPRRRTRILIRAAELAGDLNDRYQTRLLLERADLAEVGPIERARLLLVSDNAAFDPGEPSRRIHDMVGAAAGAYDVGARDVAENLLWRAAARCFFQDGDEHTRAETGAELIRSGVDPDSPLAVTIRAYTEPYRHGVDVLDRLHRFTPDPQDGRSLHFLGSGAMVIGDFTHAGRHLEQAAAVWREQGRLGLLARSLAGSWPRVYLGGLEQARDESEEGYGLAQETGETIALLGLTATKALSAVLRGDSSTAEQAVKELRADALFPHMPFATVMAQQVDGLLALFGDRPEEAYEILARVFDPADPHHHSVSCWLVAPDLADAAVAAGETAHARKLLADLPRLARCLPSEMMTSAAVYTAAVLGEDDRLFDAALPTGCRLVRARLRLQHARRVGNAPELLRAARDEFDLMGARPFAEAARDELRATGADGGRRRPVLSEGLSAQEMRIALLASQGMSDEEIARRLFISHRTVGSHLDQIYPRLGVRGRGDLATALPRAAVLPPAV
ncbi:BTAD domain-containing putative transcriptional regulator [Actinoplanes solisilvae]|uniref:BTAD domain-containing putative transcriptional regulator n=1 Tax=Actinoplanes solisilvae TaxID=2486853 RepID=UPI00196B548D|nr:BTAD domain-containing putative transcriptional regulator [Actinoplanes solisilvae]